MTRPEMVRTSCPLDCPDTCSLEVEREGLSVRRIGGSEANPVTKGFICGKVRKFHRRLTHPKALMEPLVRCGPKGAGRFETVSWDDAIGLVADGIKKTLDRWGGEAVLPFHYGGSNGLLTDGPVDDAFFELLGASRLARTFCAAPATAVAEGMYGKMPGVGFPDYVEARCIVIWGANPKASNIHLVPYLKEARRRGAVIAVIDPRRNFSGEEIDIHLPVRPGTDLVLALGIINYLSGRGRLSLENPPSEVTNAGPLLEASAGWPVELAARETGVAVDDVVRLAELYARTDPAVIRCGWGVERNQNGGQALAAILALPALLGKFGVRGGGFTLSNSGFARSAEDRPVQESPGRRVINMSQLGRVLNGDLDPPIGALVVYNCNPVATAPNQNSVIRGLAREDLFTVVMEQVMTDTAGYADVILPATTFLEHRDLTVSYGAYVVSETAPAVAPIGSRKPNYEIFRLLAAELGLDHPIFSHEPDDLVAEMMNRMSFDEELEEVADARVRRAFGGTGPIQLRNVHPRTEDGRVDLAPPALGSRPYHYLRTDSRHPLAMISPASSRMISSTLGEFNLPELKVTLNPADARSRGVSDGDRVQVFNELGRVECRAEVSGRIAEGVVSLPKGAWRQASLNGSTANALCPDTVNRVAGGACYNDARVEVRALESGVPVG